MNAFPEGGRLLTELRKNSTAPLVLQLLECPCDVQMHHRHWKTHTAANDPARHTCHPSIVLRASSVQLLPKPNLQSVCRPCVECTGPYLVVTHLCITSAHHLRLRGSESLRCDALPWGLSACDDVQGSRESLRLPPCHCDCHYGGNLRPFSLAWTCLQVETSPNSTAPCGDSELCRLHQTPLEGWCHQRLCKRPTATAKSFLVHAGGTGAPAAGEARCCAAAGAIRPVRRSQRRRRRRRLLLLRRARATVPRLPEQGKRPVDCPPRVEFDRSCPDRVSKRSLPGRTCVIGHEGVHCR